MKLYRQETWGISTWSWSGPGHVETMKQTAAAPGLTVENLLGRQLSEREQQHFTDYGEVVARP